MHNYLLSFYVHACCTSLRNARLGLRPFSPSLSRSLFLLPRLHRRACRAHVSVRIFFIPAIDYNANPSLSLSLSLSLYLSIYLFLDRTRMLEDYAHACLELRD